MARTKYLEKGRVICFSDQRNGIQPQPYYLIYKPSKGTLVALYFVRVKTVGSWVVICSITLIALSFLSLDPLRNPCGAAILTSRLRVALGGSGRGRWAMGLATSQRRTENEQGARLALHIHGKFGTSSTHIVSRKSKLEDSNKLQRLMRISSVCERTGLSKTKIYRLIGSSQFPRPIHPLGSRMSAWLEADVNEWISQQIENSRVVKGKRG